MMKKYLLLFLGIASIVVSNAPVIGSAIAGLALGFGAIYIHSTLDDNDMYTKTGFITAVIGIILCGRVLFAIFASEMLYDFFWY